jgi:hypothetical protein
VTDQIRHPRIKAANLVRIDRQLVFHPNRPLTREATSHKVEEEGAKIKREGEETEAKLKRESQEAQGRSEEAIRRSTEEAQRQAEPSETESG